MGWGLLGSIGNGFKKAGNGLLNGIDNAAMGSLTGGGLLNDALGMGSSRTPYGATPPLTGEWGAAQSPQAPQPYTPTQQERRALRGSYLMNIGAALQQGRPLGEGVQQFQQQGIAQIQAAQHARMQQRALGIQQALQQEMQGAADDATRNKVLTKYAPFIGPEATKQYAEAFKAMGPEKVTVHGQQTVAGPDGKPMLVNLMSDGTMRPATGYSPITKVTQQDMGGEKQGFDEYGNRVGAPIPKTLPPQAPAQPQHVNVPGQGLFTWDPKNPTSATPINGANGRPIVGHNPSGSNVGTWTLAEDGQGNVVEHNSKTGEIRKPQGDIQRAGTFAKNAAAEEKRTGPGRDAVAYAHEYMSGGKFTGAGDIALQEKFFELAKPSSGFRMNAAVLQKLGESRSWMGSLAAQAHHAATGTWFTDKQRQDMADTMKSLQAVHPGAAGPQAQQPATSTPVTSPQPLNPRAGYVAGHVYGGKTFMGGDPNNAGSWR